ncbi:IS200/IS605 family transposase [Bizionia myxarmorum]|uniref:IS200/IS605 family transposase n=1 Tax=Bizionia myxarmorum TaxID=291186 RepID=A0A5D0RES4_9FLAO|nr:IS200/IS605 family transposase [Bizionia myxarmorum]TYB79054.1 IS200/IS605 family transposase [Bizionia myxarmorum]
MSQSLVKNYVHIIFSTKYRSKWIHPPHEEKLHAYIAGVCNNLECHVLIVGGYTDHIHILCMLSKKIALMTLVQKVKANASRWMKDQDTSLGDFCWQNGYGAFSVKPSETDVVFNYIKNQHEHHAQKTFKEEYLTFLKTYNMDYDERYIWD